MSDETPGEEPEEPGEEPIEEAAADEPTAQDESVSEDEQAPLSSLRERLEAREGSAAESDAEDPLSALAAEASASSEAEESDLFEKVDVGEIDSQAVWDAIADADSPNQEILGDREGPATAAEPTSKRAEHVIDKREYCQRCEFFTEPPSVSCTNEGTEILELVDNDRFRVRNCPKVKANAEELQSLVDDEQA